MFEPYTKTVITCNGRSNDLSVIDPIKKKVIKTIDVGGKPEKAVSDGEGKLFVNIEDKNEIVEVNLKNYTVQNHWSLNGGEVASGLVYDPETKRLFSTCDKQLIVMDATSGKVISKLPIGEGCDGAAIDLKKKIIFTSNGEGTITAIKENDANNYKILGNFSNQARRPYNCYRCSYGYIVFANSRICSEYTGRTKTRNDAGTFQVLEVK